ncbi:MAG: UDP-N-acetylglucosamine 2-epimerase [Gammaproteobacteria bacterium RIFCSPHIGHO2_12_FULL_35_23]|nr:MAG: UDP-N-acetylglucosamine 2-epimerase [Gammaproteobacteria bacterium RIFCSPHIGHO2_12_FULL_35_23]
MKKVLFIFGTRPEAIKMAPIILLMKADTQFEVKICVTAQHREMLDQVLNLFAIKPDYDLQIMQANQDLYDITAKALLALRQIIQQEKPDIILVQGDTTTCFVGALAGFYQKVPVAHVEAGLRTYDLQQPFPEEANRTLTSRLAALHFAPTETSKANLIAEKINSETVFVTGNTVIDALFLVRDQVKQQPNITASFGKAKQIVESKQPIILVTGHRRESFGYGFEQICQALAVIAENHPAWQIIYPVHLNPNVQKPVNQSLGHYPNIHLIDPLDYAPFVYLMDKAKLILTDSGGVQEEAPSLGKPVLVMRELTERPEAVKVGTVILVGTNKEKIISETESLMSNESRYQEMTLIHNPYGDGYAAKRIVNCIDAYFKNKQELIKSKSPRSD